MNRQPSVAYILNFGGRPSNRAVTRATIWRTGSTVSSRASVQSLMSKSVIDPLPCATSGISHVGRAGNSSGTQSANGSSAMTKLTRSSQELNAARTRFPIPRDVRIRTVCSGRAVGVSHWWRHQEAHASRSPFHLVAALPRMAPDPRTLMSGATT